MPPTDSVMADHRQEEGSLESGASVAESVSCVSVAQASFTGAVCLSVISTQKDDSPTKIFKAPVQSVKVPSSAAARHTASEGMRVCLEIR